MNKINCNIIKDLLPLYIDNLTSNESNEIIEEHLNSCNECQIVYEQMNTPIEAEQEQNRENEIDYLKKVKTKTIKNYVFVFSIIAIIAVLTFVFLIGMRVKSDDVNIVANVYDENEGSFKIVLSNGKRLNVTTRPISGMDDNGDIITAGYVLTPYSVLTLPGKDCNNYTIGYPLTRDFNITIRFRDKDVVYVVRSNQLLELKEPLSEGK
ncbi:zf-HC2 domain-containing protein [Sedimentibacter sp.]|uniref:zf-HC2 domain-containing protein n=1 Tax=Sedimentibacter sp. TaxID=1960295 RepID=UPI0028AE3D26|nr:zf-HC2 domain-containing protein [Sedimentibacter sp.]